jgi:hypothetical protein
MVADQARRTQMRRAKSIVYANMYRMAIWWLVTTRIVPMSGFTGIASASKASQRAGGSVPNVENSAKKENRKRSSALMMNYERNDTKIKQNKI